MTDSTEVGPRDAAPPATYSVVTCADEGWDHYVLDERIQAVLRDAFRRKLPALCGHELIRETSLARHRGIRCADCRDKLQDFDPPLAARGEPPVTRWASRTPSISPADAAALASWRGTRRPAQRPETPPTRPR